MKKGSKCCVIGRLQNSSYEAQDGTKRYSTDIIAEEVEFLGTKPSDGESIVKNDDAPIANGTSELQPIDDDSLPF